ncbi:MAG: 50S ribosomal protein L24 [Flavobacteriaceae bacterium]|nr:50S ribosomal protein L24 [Flavobacteriaceae bacterium]
MKIKKGDQVIVLAGKEKGKTGEVVRVFPAKERVLVQHLNMIKKHTKPSANNPQGGITEVEAPIHVSNVSLIDPETGKPTRVGYKTEGDKKVRFAIKSGKNI